MPRPIIASLITLLVCLLGAGAAHAQGSAAKPKRPPSSEADRISRAEAAFKRAGAAFDAGKLDVALANYQESYALWPRPRTLLNLGVVLRKLGRVAEAANLLAEYVEHEAADAERVDAVRRTLAELDAELGRVQIAQLGSGPVTLDGQEIQADLLDRPVRVPVGQHRISQSGDTVQIAVSKGQELSIEVGRAAPEPAVVAPPPPPPAEEKPVVVAPPPRGPRPTRHFLWTGAVTLVAAGATGFLAYRLGTQQDELDEILARPQMYEYAEAEEARDRAERTALLTNIGIGVTAAGVVATGVLFFLYDDERPAAPRVSSTVAPDGRGVSFSLTGAW